MKPSPTFKLIVLLAIMLLGSISCTLPFNRNQSTDSMENVISDAKISQDPTSTPTGEDTDGDFSQRRLEVTISKDHLTNIGNLSEDAFSISIPSGSFQHETSADVYILDDLPESPGEGFLGLGPVIQVELESGQGWSEEPMQVSISFNSENMIEEGEIKVGYYHEDFGWFVFEPDEVDLDSGVLTFTTRHFSTYSGLHADEMKRIELFVERRATEEFIKQTNQEINQAQMELMVETILRESAGIHDNRVLEIIIRGVIKELPGGGTALTLYDMDVDDLTNLTLSKTLDQLGKLLSDDEDSALRDLTGSAGTVGAFASAAGAFAEGDIEGGLKIMAEEIADNIPGIDKIKSIGETVVELTDEVILNVWFNPELEKAFQVYKNGAEGSYFGRLSISPRNWEQLTGQMKGVFTKVESDYVTRYCKDRGIDPNSLSLEDRTHLTNLALGRIRDQFEARVSREAEINAIAQTKLELMSMFADKNLLDRSESTNPMFAGFEDLEMLMTRLENLTDRLLRDTDRATIVDHHTWNSTDPFDRESMIPMSVLVELAFQFHNKNLNDNTQVYQNLIEELQNRLQQNKDLSATDIMDLTDKLIDMQKAGLLDEDSQDEEGNIGFGDGVSPEDMALDIQNIEDHPHFRWDKGNNCWQYIGPPKANYTWNCQSQCFDYKDENWVLNCATSNCPLYIGANSDVWSWNCETNCFQSLRADWTYDCSTWCPVYIGDSCWYWNCQTDCWEYRCENYTYDCSTRCLVYTGPESHLWRWDCARMCLDYVGPPVEGYYWSCEGRRWVPTD